MSKEVKIPKKLPLLILEEKVLFPGMSRKISMSPGNKNFELIKSRFLSANIESPEATTLVVGVMPFAIGQQPVEGTDFDWRVGTAATVDHVVAQGWPNPMVTLVVTGLRRIKVEKLVMEVPYPVGVLDQAVKQKDELDADDTESQILGESLRITLLRLVDLVSDVGSSFGVGRSRINIENYPLHWLPDSTMSHVVSSFAEKLSVLNAFDLAERLKLVMPIVMRQTKVMEFFQKNGLSNGGAAMPVMRLPVLRRMGGTANALTGLKVLMPSSGAGAAHSHGGADAEEDAELYNKLKEAHLPPQAWKIAQKEYQRLRRVSPSSPEMNVLRTYLELMAELPWAKSSVETLDINKARRDLEVDHHAMEALKRRVLEYLAVRRLKNSLRGPILCFVGPPGVGKTSIGRSIAHTLGREFHRISLGGTCNQSDIRGHRRTYIGAMPGRIIQGLKAVGVNNPVFLLDEIDKVKAGLQGDPAAALLEVLDPEQNHTFHDHYLNTPFDLSQVMFIATANSTATIPSALLDRMEVIKVDGYTTDEKMHIAARHLIPKLLRQHGLDSEAVQIPSDTVARLISGYTHEAGVRSLERKIAALCRDVAVAVAEHGTNPADETPCVVDDARMEEVLGPAPYSDTELWSRLGRPGVAMGLAATAAGGQVLLVEAGKMAGEGRLQLTGRLGGVMKESAKLALTWLRTAAHQYGLSADCDAQLARTDVHVHFPAGAVSKDGPSAGVAVCVVLLSLFAGRPVATDVAMTGEISLKGAVLPVGGIKSKVLAAHRYGIKRVILPEKNAKDLLKLPDQVREEMSFVLVSHIDDAIQAAFEGGFPLSAGSPEELEPALSKL